MTTANLLRFLGWPVATGIIGALVILWLLPGPSSLSNSSNDTTPLSGPTSYSRAVSNAAPSVVNIYTRKRIQRAEHPLLDDPVLRQLTNAASPRTSEKNSQGSGVILSSDGYIITNLHVLTRHNEILISLDVYVQLQDGRTTMAEIVGTDKVTDLAVLKIDLDKLTPANIGDAMKARVGDVVLAIGNPLGVGQTVTQGIISASGQKKFGEDQYRETIQTDAAINPGNSGGALINAYGELLGINSFVLDASGKNSYGISFAIPMSTVVKVLNDIREYGHVVRGYIGDINISNLRKMQLQELNMGRYQSALLVNELNDGPASSAGLRAGDIIIGINGQRRTDRAYISKTMLDLLPDDAITLDIVRGTRELQITVVASVAPAQVHLPQ